MINLSLTEINIDDLLLLDQLRVERLRHFFSESLLHCVIRLDCNQTLIIDCPEASIVDTVLSDLEELCDYTWRILVAHPGR